MKRANAPNLTPLRRPRVEMYRAEHGDFTVSKFLYMLPSRGANFDLMGRMVSMARFFADILRHVAVEKAEANHV